jgi:uncharacterized membrane protein
VLLASGGFGLPGDVVAQHSVEGCDHLAHDGDDDDFWLFVGGGETMVKDFESRIVPASAQSCHVELLWYVLETIFPDEVRDPQFFLTFIIVFVPLVMLVYFGLAFLNYDAIAAQFGRPTALPLGPLSPEALGAAVCYIGLTVWLWSRWRKL